jgi:putative ABC transport system permease protein
MPTFIQDLRYGYRSLRGNPVFSIVAIATLVLGIGANTAIFSVVNSVLLRPLPYHDPDRIIAVWQKTAKEDNVRFSTPEFREWTTVSRVFDGLAASVGNGFTLTGQGEPAMFLGQQVTPNLFQVLGVNAKIGRLFAEEEGQPGHDHVVLLSNGLWKSSFGSDPSVSGRVIHLNGEPYTIVGVMDESFSYPASEYRLWVPAALSSGIFQKFPNAHLLRVIGRLKPGVSEAELQGELSAIERQMAAAGQGDRRELRHAPLQKQGTAGIREPLLVIMCAVGLLLLIACSNVANLFLARATARQREIAIRVALGASRWRIVRQLTVESLMVAAIGGALGCVLARWLLRSVLALTPQDVPGIRNAGIDSYVMIFALAVSVVTGVIFGLVPILSGGLLFTGNGLHQRGSIQGATSSARVRSLLMFGEVALSVVLLTSSLLMLQSFVRLQRVDPGFQTAGTLTASFALPEGRYPEAANLRSFYRRTLVELQSQPGIEAAAFNTALPFSGQGWGNSVDIEGHPTAPGETRIVQVQCVSPQYFTAMGIAVLKGRSFSDYDREDSLPVAIVDAESARTYWPGEDPIGKRLDVDGGPRTVVGIVHNVKRSALSSEEQPQVYLPYPQLAPELTKFLGRGLFVAVRSGQDATAVAASVRSAIHAVDSQVALVNVSTMGELLSESVAEPRFRTVLLGAFSALALLLASIGIYGVMSYIVSQRWREIGIRLALGADRRVILRLIVGKALVITAVGVVAGWFGSLAAARMFASLLFGVTPHDLRTYAMVPVILITVALLASYIPARRAAGLDPMIALRYE